MSKPRRKPKKPRAPRQQASQSEAGFVPAHLRGATFDEHGRRLVANPGWQRNGQQSVPQVDPNEPPLPEAARRNAAGPMVGHDGSASRA
ncbi:hypothetical protein [Verrucosispora sp. WMMD1129]|uniref:hypothetical protein n=1 Tax=Verrucosispora sp. WMMD1129 TaxID=3016093 RepID=UPI00249CBFF8|nr:hypothetical protein [Verrucosispora sp. WMMD1129]WFE47738.1 hypothetical protein O7624_27100 [Verrucosispora sp. WMMD1129]